MDPPMLPPIKRTYPITFQSLHFEGDSDEYNPIDPHPKQAIPNSSTFEGMPIGDLETILAQAPERAQQIITHLKDPQHYGCPNYRATCFIRGPGLGKTVTAKAIAYHLTLGTTWHYEYISSQAFIRPYRNQTGGSLDAYLDKISVLEQPTLLIVDQLNKILEYPDDAEDDTRVTSSILCTFLDENRNNQNLFFIGIMDRVSELCERVQGRLVHLGAFFKKIPTDPNVKRIIFSSKCINDYTQLHPEVTNEWLANFLAQAPTITGRNFRGLALQVKDIIEKEKRDEKEVAQITKNHLEMALIAYVAAKKDIEHVDPYEAYQDKKWRELEELHQQRMRGN